MPPLEDHHSPLTDAFAARRPEAETPLSADQLESFERDGFLAPLPLLTLEQVQDLRQALERIGAALHELAPVLHEVEAAWLERPDEVVLHFLGAWRVEELFHDLVFHPGVTARAAAALGVGRLRFWHDQVFWKPAGHPGIVPWHQDYSYWSRTRPACHITAFVALDDCDEISGSVEVIPGSHRWPLSQPVDFGGARDQLLERLTPEQQRQFEPVPLLLRAGEMSLHHSHLIHGSGPNTSRHPRRAAVLNYMADGTLSDSAQPLLRGVPAIPVGQPLGGPFFPLVIDRGEPQG